DADLFCRMLQKRLDAKWRKVRLPSEGMFEFACRAGTMTTWFTGNEANGTGIHFAQEGLGRLNRTRSVALGGVNAFGLVDMVGNVSHLCSDNWGWYDRRPQADPEGSDRGDAVVCRGGSWSEGAQNCRSAYRTFVDRSTKRNNLGFRVVLVPAIP